MSHLNLPDGIPDFAKAVISFWFRVPISSMNAALAQAAADPTDPRPRLSGIIPLMTFGPMYEGYQVVTSPGVAASYTETTKIFDGANYVVLSSSTHPYSNSMYETGDATEINPSFVGVRCDDDEGVVSGSLMVRFQMKDFGSGTWVYWDQPVTFGNKTILSASAAPIEGATGPPSDTAWSTSLNECLMDEVAPEGPWNVSHGEVDNTGIFARKDGPDSFDLAATVVVEPDQWHHVLISVDFSLGTITAQGRKAIFDTPDCTIGDSGYERVMISDEIVSAVANPAKMWVSFDDIDYVDEQGVSGVAAGVAGLGNNGVAPQNAYRAATGINAATIHQKTWNVTGCVEMFTFTSSFGIPDYQYEPSLVPGKDHALGIPAAPELVDRIHPVELSELQIFTGVTLDTADTSRRRAFVSEEGRPVNPQEAEALLGRKPDVLLHGSGNWIHGINTGPPYVPNPESGGPETIPDPAEALTPTGTIAAYRPDPSLHGDQGPSPSLLRSPGR